jgi:hypothetical protein
MMMGMTSELPESPPLNATEQIYATLKASRDLKTCVLAAIKVAGVDGTMLQVGKFMKMLQQQGEDQLFMHLHEALERAPEGITTSSYIAAMMDACFSIRLYRQ